MKLTEKQNEAINEIKNNLQIIACAGSGKTEVITRRIAKILEEDKSVTPKNIVAFTFTKKASESMKNRIERNCLKIPNFDISKLDEMYIGTIHSFCYNMLIQNCDEFKDFKVLDEVKSFHFIKRYFDYCGITNLELKSYSLDIKIFLNCIDKMILEYSNIDKWNDKSRNAFYKYKKCLYEKKYFDYALLIHEAILQFERNPEILKDIKYLIVDEYQDIDDLQEEIVKCFYKSGTNICIVGDDDQTIYRFRRK